MLTFQKHQTGSLRNEAAEHGEGGGGAAAQEVKPPGIIEQAMAGLRSKATLNAEIAQIRTERDTATARVAELETQVATLGLQVKAYQADQDRLENALREAAEEAQSVDEAAAAKITAIGIPNNQLPAAGQDAQDTADSLRDKLKVEKDTKERFRLQQRIDALESA